MRRKIILGFILVAVFFAIYQWGYNAASYQGEDGKFWNSMFNTTAANLRNAVKKVQADDAENASLSTQINLWKNQPTPTPEVIYKTNTITQTKTQYVPQTQYVEEPAQQTQIHCTDNGFTGLLHQMNCTSE